MASIKLLKKEINNDIGDLIEEIYLWELSNPDGDLTKSEKQNAKLFLESHSINLQEPLYMISVLGSNMTKTYPFAHMAKVLDVIVNTKPNAQLLFNYIPKQLEDAKAIYHLCKPETQQRIHIDVFGKSLRDFMCITHFCDALIGNEGGAINMAKALNIKTFTIFSPWIRKEVWSLFEDNINHVSVHLKDYKVDLFIDKSTKDLKEIHTDLYDTFSLELFKDKLIHFLK